MSSICIIITIGLPNYLHQDSSGQLSSMPTKPNQPIKPGEGFRVGITMFGVTKDTGNVFSFVKVGDATTGRYSNVSKDDSKDHDGVVDSVMSLSNLTVPTGTNFTACYVILKDLTMSCESGINIQGRPQSIQFVLKTFKEKVT